jgi:hypothetical protein
VGAIVLLAQREPLLPSYVAASVALVCLTTYAGLFPRYLAPVTPLLALFLAESLAAFRVYTQRRWSTKGRAAVQIATALIVSTILVVQLYTVVRLYKWRYEQGPTYAGQGEQRGSRLFFYDHTWRDYDRALTWLKEVAKSDAVVASSAPHWTYLQTGLKTVVPPMEVDPEKAQQLVDSVPVNYVILGEIVIADIAGRYAKPAIQKYPKLWKLVYRAEDSLTWVYQRAEENGDGLRSR